MSITTYSELQTAIGNYLNRSDLSSRIPEFIDLSEGKINRRIRHHQQKVLATASYGTSVTSRRIDIPSNTIEILNVQIKVPTDADTEYESLTQIAPERIETKYCAAGKPEYFAFRGDIEFERLADQTYTIRVHYLKRWDIATDSTNWLLTYYPDVYVYGALLEATPYLGQDSRLPMWKSMFDSAVQEINDEATRMMDDDEMDVSDLAMMGFNRTRYNVVKE